MGYIGSTPTTQNFISGTDYFNGNGSTTAFTLTRTIASVNDIQVVVNNVVQQPNSGYTVIGSTLTFDQAPSTGTNNIYVRYLSTTTQAITPSQGTVNWNTLDSNTQQDLGLMYKNKIINGNMVIAQRGTGTTSTAFLNQVDQFQVATNSGTFTFGQSTNAPTGFNYSALVTNTASLTPSGTNYYSIRNVIEGLNVANLAWGTANAKTVTLSFWVRSSVTGTFGGSLFNGSVNRSYPFTYTISSANTWEQKSITITGDTSGTWATDNSAGIYIEWALGTGSTYQGTAGAWAAARYQGATGQTQWSTTNGATFYLTGVQLEVGTQATAFSTAGGSYGAELALCYRYYYRLVSTERCPVCTCAAYNSVTAFGVVNFPVAMRTAPDIDQTSTTSQFYISGNNASGAFNTFGYNERGPNSITLYNNQNLSIVQGYAYWFRTNASVSGQKLAFTAEL